MANIDEPRVSVVTPVYNGEKHIATTIKSVLAQRYTNWEYIIVDNCCTDRTPEIAQEWATRDSRIRVVRNESLLDVVRSHNRAFSVAPPENKYIKIVAADDWLFQNCLTDMVALAEAHPTVGMVSSYVLSGAQVSFDGLPFEDLPFEGTVVNGREICRMYFMNSVSVFGGPSASLLRTSVVKAQLPFYTVDSYHGDYDAYMRLLQEHDFGYVHQVLTYRRRGENSRTTHMLEHLNSHIVAFVEEMTTFGPVFLKPEELKARMQAVTDEYYEFLARQAFEFRDRKFWGTHFERLNKVGTPFEKAKFSRFVFLRFIDMLFNPKRTIEGAARRLFQRD